jgi:hypothetical protein
MDAPRTKAERRRTIEFLASQLVDAFEAHQEFKAARDRKGDKDYHNSRRRLIRLLVDFGREVALAARGR